MRVMSDPPGPSIMLAWIEIVLATIFFFSSIFYVRPAKRVAKALQKAEKLNQQTEKLNQQTEKLNRQAEKLNQKTENLN